MRKIGLLGGTGFVGKPLINRLIKMGWQIRILTHRREKHRELCLLPQIELVSANIHDQEELNKQLACCEVVINLVGILNEAGNDGSGFRKVHVELPEKLIIACHNNNIKRLLHISAMNADAEQKSHYLRTKGEAEDLFHAAQDLQVTTFKPSLIFGEGAPFFNRFAALLRVPTPIFMLPLAETKFAPVWVNDVGEAMVKTLDNPESYGQRYNLCGPKTYTLQELVAYIAKLIRVKRQILPLKEKHSHWIARFMDKLGPTKPFSLDNFHSSQVESVCGKNNHLLQLGITPRAIEIIMPKYFSNASTPRELYSTFRQLASR
jgi:NADH dehydrogenase